MQHTNEIKTIFWNERSTFDRLHGAMFHNELARLGIRTGDALYANTESGESALSITADNQLQIEQARNLLESYDVGVSQVEAISAIALPQRTLSDALFTLPEAARKNFGHQQTIHSNKHLDVILHSVLTAAHVTHVSNSSSEEGLLARSKEAGLYINHWDTQIAAGQRWSIMLPMGESPNTFSEIARSAGIISMPAWKSDAIWNPAADNFHRMARCIFKGFNPHDVEDAVQWAMQDLFDRVDAASLERDVDETVLAEDLRLFMLRVKWRLLDMKRATARRNNVPLDDLDTSETLAKVPGLLSPFDYAALREAQDVLAGEVPAWLQSLRPAEKDRLSKRARGETFEAIARDRGEPVGTVKASVSRALNRLQTKLQNKTGITMQPKALHDALSAFVSCEDEQQADPSEKEPHNDNR